MKIIIEVLDFILRTVRPQVLANSLEFDTMLAKEALVFLESINEVPFLETLLPAPRGLWGYHTALDFCFNTIGAWLILVASDLALLAEDAAGPSGELHGRGVVGLLLVL